jgi:hypothetical protein
MESWVTGRSEHFQPLAGWTIIPGAGTGGQAAGAVLQKGTPGLKQNPHPGEPGAFSGEVLGFSGACWNFISLFTLCRWEFNN